MTRTGIVRDDLFVQHIAGEWHPESPERLTEIYRVLDGKRSHALTTLPRRHATKEEITLVHGPDYYDHIARTAGRSRVQLDPDTATSPMSFEAATAAAGGLIQLVDRVLDGDLDNGFALIRPPGHHAEANRAMGFCLFNNVAVAAAWAIKHRGLGRVMIVDWDVHHGNGTQHSFYNNPQVLYVSTHQYPFYPGTGGITEVGAGPGRGYTINIPLSYGHGDEDFVAIFQSIVLPVAQYFQPELILVSAGFDIHRLDPLGGMNVGPEGFAAMTRLLNQAAEDICGGRLVLTLEGGYHLEGEAQGVEAVLDTLTRVGSLGEDLARTPARTPAIVDQVRQIQSDFWLL